MALTKYSEKEKQLFSSLGFSRLMEVFDNEPKLYHEVSLQVFIEGRSGKCVDSLRRCLQSIRSLNGIYRLTPEFDNLIELDQ